MLRALLALAVLGLTIYAVLDCVRSEGSRRTVAPTWMWVALIIILPVVGALIWLTISRAADANPQPGRRPMPKAPDDDPEFLRHLQQLNRRDTDTTPDTGSGEAGRDEPRIDPKDDHRGRRNDGHASDDHPSDGR